MMENKSLHEFECRTIVEVDGEERAASEWQCHGCRGSAPSDFVDDLLRQSRVAVTDQVREVRDPEVEAVAQAIRGNEYGWERAAEESRDYNRAQARAAIAALDKVRESKPAVVIEWPDPRDGHDHAADIAEWLDKVATEESALRDATITVREGHQ